MTKLNSYKAHVTLLAVKIRGNQVRKGANFALHIFKLGRKKIKVFSIIFLETIVSNNKLKPWHTIQKRKQYLE